MKKPKQNYSSLNMLAHIQAVPTSAEAFRMPDEIPGRTSVLRFTEETPVEIPASGVSYAMITRTPTRQVWLSKVGSASVAASASFSRRLIASPPPVPNNPGESEDLSTIFYADSNLPGWTRQVSAPTEFMGQYCPAVDDKNRLWFYYPSGGYHFGIKIKSTAATNVGTWTITFEHISSFSTSTASSFSVTAGSGDETVEAFFSNPSFTGWLRPVSMSCTTATSLSGVIYSVELGTLTGGTFSAPVAPSAASPPYVPSVCWEPPDQNAAALTVKDPWADSRVTAVGVLFMNETSNFTKEGHANGVRLSDKTSLLVFNTEIFDGYDGYWARASDSSKYSGPLAKGMYVFSKPDKLSTEFRDWTTMTYASVATVVRLDSFDCVDVVRFTDRNSTSATTMQVVTTFHLEWRNTTSLWTTGVQRMPYEAWRQAIATLAEINNYSENSTHISDILRRVKTALQWAGPIVKPYAKQAGMALMRGALL